MKSPVLQIDPLTDVERSDTFFIPLKNYISKYLNLWQSCDNCIPELNGEYPIEKKLMNKKRMDDFLHSLDDHFNTYSENSKDQTSRNKKLFSRLRNLFEHVFEFSPDVCELVFSDEMTKATEDFLSDALKFNPHLSKKEIYQALRNVWIMNTIQLFLNKPVQDTLSVHAYSLLYPYSDNVIDDPKLPQAEKIDYHTRFGLRLKGQKITPRNSNECDIYKLIEMIEKQYSRKEFPQVWASLYAIHKAQQKSIIQQNNQSLSQNEILKISIEKGGSSVLADAYLVDPYISEDVAEFMFGFGVLLQFADDLQDVDTDKQNRHRTIFSDQGGKIPLDQVTNRLFKFMKRILSINDSKIREIEMPIRDLIFGGCKQLLLRSINKNRYYFTDEYVNEIDKYSSYPFSYRIEFSKRMKKIISKMNVKKEVSH